MSDFPKRSHWRDHIAVFLCNLILNTIATPWYRESLRQKVFAELAMAKYLKMKEEQEARNAESGGV